MSTILIITKNYAPAICGVGDHTAHLERELAALGNKVIILTGAPGHQDVDVLSVKCFNGSMYGRLKRLIAQEKIERILWQYVPYSYQRKGLPFWWPLLMLRLGESNVKQFIFFHEVSLRWWGYGLKQLMIASGQRLIANLASLIAAGSFTSIPLYASYFVFRKPRIVPISANMGEGGKLVNGSWLPIAIGMTGGIQKTAGVIPNQIFCFANRADKALLRAVKNINEQVPVKLVLGGMIHAPKKDQLFEWIRELNLEPAVCFTGVLAPDALTTIIAESAIFMQPQIVERANQGGISAKNGTVMAAMAMGKAIISCGGDMTDPAIFKQEANMLLVPYGDTGAYEKAIARLLKDPSVSARLGAAAAATYGELCSWEVTGRLIERQLQPPVSAAPGKLRSGRVIE